MSVQSELRVLIGQMTSVDDWKANEAQIWELLQKIEDPSRADLISFPENSLFLKLHDDQSMEGITLDNSIFDRISGYCADNGCSIHLGSVPLKAGTKVFNSTVLIDGNGKRSAPYNKIHLFDVDIAGHRSYRESDSVRAGESPSVVEVKGWKIGLSICYDLRFSNLYHSYAKLGVDLILVPAAFTVPTGRAHWETLLRARAIESQCYVVAAAQEGSHGGKRETYGHSIAIDPWGEVMAVRPKGIGLLDVTLTQERLKQVRSQIPMAHHRRGPF